jgi:hypothetical protein
VEHLSVVSKYHIAPKYLPVTNTLAYSTAAAMMLKKKFFVISSTSLQQHLADSEKRLGRFAEESSRNASAANFNEKLRNDLKKVIGELEKAHLDIQDRVSHFVFATVSCNWV